MLVSSAEAGNTARGFVEELVDIVGQGGSEPGGVREVTWKGPQGRLLTT